MVIINMMGTKKDGDEDGDVDELPLCHKWWWWW